MLINTLTGIFGTNLPIFALLFIGIVVEKYYVSRVTTFTNVIALNMSFLNLETVPRFLVWYGDLGLLLGIYGMLAYLLNAKTGKVYRIPAFTMYASLPVAAVILTAPMNWWLAVLVAGIVNVVGGVVFELEFGIDVTHWEPRHGEVSRFINTRKMEFIDPHGVHQHVDLELGKFERR